jgi:ABC-type glycerol-3-phosphate transport system substrate-binding protein
MQHNKKILLFIYTLVCFTLLFLTACTQKEEASSNEKSGREVADNGNENKGTEEQTTDKVEQNGEKTELEKLAELASKEGKIVISGAPSEKWREALIKGFNEKYPDIKVEYSAHNGRDFWPKLLQERDVDKYLWDLRIGGPDAIGWEKARRIDLPIRAMLLPEIADDNVWIGGLNGLFVDKTGEYIPAFQAYSQAPVSVNRDFISEADLASPKDLLKPEFKGKIVINDPRGGAGLGYLTVLLAEYGEDFVKQLLTEQELVVTRDNRQMVEWAVRGNYPIVIGLDNTFLPTFQEEGIGLNIKELAEGPRGISFGFGMINALDNPPNPNAQKLYINWLLSKEGQTQLVEILQLNSRRKDVQPTDNKLIAIDESVLEAYIPHQAEAYEEKRVQAQKMAMEHLK